jgi:putative ABC transport system ATP-binding protein
MMNVPLSHSPDSQKSRVSTLYSALLSKSFTSGQFTQRAVYECSIEVYAGELTLIIGPSGSGKSTLLSMLSGLMRPDSGRVIALGTDLWQLDAKSLASYRLANCGFVFQGFNLFQSLTALENVILPVQYMGLSVVEARRRATTALDDVGLGSRAHLRPAELSGGEKQRVAIARALVKRPRLIFADEPTSALDGTNGQIVIDLLKNIATTYNTTVLGVTHDPRLLSHASRIIELEDGRIVSDTRPNATTTTKPLASPADHAQHQD